MQVNLQVVGLFYNVELEMPDSGAKVIDLMNAAIDNPSPAGSINGAKKFSYSTHVDTPNAIPTMSSMTAVYTDSFQSRVLGKSYDPGVYSLAETFDPTVAKAQYSVCQYYLFDSDEKYLNVFGGSTSFVDQSLDGVARVSWRLVSILGQPTATLPEVDSLSARNPVRRAAGM